MELKTAAHVSACIPIYFKPVAIDIAWSKVSIKNNNNYYDLYVNGGMVCNYPTNMFDSCLNGNDPFFCDDLQYNNPTLGLKLERPAQIHQFNNDSTDVAPYHVPSLYDYILAMINLLMETLNRKTPGLQNEKERTIYITYGNIFGKPRKVSLSEKK